MSELKDNYKKIIEEIETHFQNENDVIFVKDKINEVTTLFMDILDRLTYITNSRIEEFEEKQNQLEDKIEDVKQTVTGIENDIYEDEEMYEFEIICPYCNYEFVTDINSENNTEIECPECKNIIELDWEEDDDTQTHCCSDGECNCEECGYQLEEDYNASEAEGQNQEEIEEQTDLENNNEESEKDEEDEDM